MPETANTTYKSDRIVNKAYAEYVSKYGEKEDRYLVFVSGFTMGYHKRERETIKGVKTCN